MGKTGYEFDRERFLSNRCLHDFFTMLLRWSIPSKPKRHSPSWAVSPWGGLEYIKIQLFHEKKCGGGGLYNSPVQEQKRMCVNAETLEQLLDAHAAALALYVRQWCDTPEDIVQDVFMLLMREPSVPQNVIGWLYAAARNKAINAAKSARRRTQHEAHAARRAELWLESRDADRLDAAVAARALAELPLDQREAIVARLWGGLSLVETARLLGTSLSTAYRRYQQGIVALQKRLDGKCQETKTRQ